MSRWWEQYIIHAGTEVRTPDTHLFTFKNEFLTTLLDIKNHTRLLDKKNHQQSKPNLKIPLFVFLVEYI